MRKDKKIINTTSKRWLKVVFSLLGGIPWIGPALVELLNALLDTIHDRGPADVNLKLALDNSKKYYQLLISQGRFKHLEISKDIMPDFHNTSRGLTADITNDEHSLIQNAEKAWDDNSKHLLLVGEGGMGKTVSLINIWSHYLQETEKNKPVPLFIALNEFNYVNQVDCKLGFICSKIIETYLPNNQTSNITADKVFELLNAERKAKKKEVQKNKPTTILLLDGFNEITKTDKTVLIFELKQIIEKYKNIQIIITSRYDIRNSRGWNNCFNKLDLKPLKEHKIENYLLEKSIPLPKDKTLRQLIENPMMLSLYAISCEVLKNHKDNPLIKFKGTIETSGELIWNYIEGQVAASIERHSDENTLYFNIFLLKEILPYIGHEMERRGRYDLSFSELQEVIGSSYTEYSNIRYKNILSGAYGFNYINVLRLKSEIDGFINDTIQILTHELMMLVNECTELSNTYRFLHQNFRDFFAAVYIINDIKAAIINSDSPKTLEERIIPVYIKRLIGEIEGEQYKKRQLEADGYKFLKNESIFSSLLEQYRGRLERDRENVVCNIVDIWKVARGELSGVDLTKLNLKGYIFNNVICGRRGSSGYISARFDDSKLDLTSFIPQGHYQWVYSAVYNKDNSRFLSSSRDGTVKEWNIESGECIYTYSKYGVEIYSAKYISEAAFLAVFSDATIRKISIANSEVLTEYSGHGNRINSIAFNRENTKMLTAADDKTIRIWDIESGECINTIAVDNTAKCAVFSFDATRVLYGCVDGYIIEKIIESNDTAFSYRGHEGNVNCVFYDKYNTKILSCSDDATIKEWDISRKSVISVYRGHTDKVNSVFYNSDENKILSASSDNTIKEWSVENCTCIHTYDEHYDCVFSAIYSNGEEAKILSASRDFSIREWNISTGECIHTYEGLSYFSRTAMFSLDSKKSSGCFL